jgi:hypothetical protein
MRLVALTLGLGLVVPALADARPLTFGVGLGRTQSAVDGDGQADDTLQLFGRIGLTARLGAQLEVQRIEDDSNLDNRTATALLVVELGGNGKLVPLLVAGFGVDHVSSDWGYEASGSHKEGGIGLEYRADGGLTIGADLRLGGRSIEQSGEVYPLDVRALIAPGGLVSGEYRSGRVYAGVRF